MKQVPGKQIVQTNHAPQAIGPYSQAVKTQSMIFTAGQIALDPATMNLVEGDVAAQTRQVLINLRHVLEAAGSSSANIVKTTVYLADMNDFASMNTVYTEFFQQDPPARSTVAVVALPKGALVEIDAVALLE